MDDEEALESVLLGARVEPPVFELRPDYRALLVAAHHLAPGPGDDVSEALLRRAEAQVRQALSTHRAEELPHVAAWREAYRAFGAKPQRTRSSVEALIRRADSGLPRVNRLTDLYNAISVIHQLPVGGEDLGRYRGTPRLARATGTEPFDTTAAGAEVIEHPEPGEVVWRDEAGVTCRRWNWRQARRTRLQDHTTAALFIFDALDPLTDAQVRAAGDDLIAELRLLGPNVAIAQRFLANPSPTPEDT